MTMKRSRQNKLEKAFSKSVSIVSAFCPRFARLKGCAGRRDRVLHVEGKIRQFKIQKLHFRIRLNCLAFPSYVLLLAFFEPGMFEVRNHRYQLLSIFLPRQSDDGRLSYLKITPAVCTQKWFKTNRKDLARISIQMANSLNQ